MIEGWRPLSANATGYGLVMLTAYIAAAWLCFDAARACRAHSHKQSRTAMARECQLWQAMAALLVVLAAYRQFDLTELVTGVGRTIAVHGKWYGHRRPIQLAMVWTTATVVIAGAAIVWRVVAAANPLALTVLAACTVLVLLFGVNALSFHAIDALFHRGYHRVTVYNGIEAGSLATILAAALAYRQQAMAVRR